MASGSGSISLYTHWVGGVESVGICHLSVPAFEAAGVYVYLCARHPYLHVHMYIYQPTCLSCLYKHACVCQPVVCVHTSVYICGCAWLGAHVCAPVCWCLCLHRHGYAHAHIFMSHVTGSVCVCRPVATQRLPLCICVHTCVFCAPGPLRAHPTAGAHHGPVKVQHPPEDPPAPPGL